MLQPLPPSVINTQGFPSENQVSIYIYYTYIIILFHSKQYCSTDLRNVKTY